MDRFCCFHYLGLYTHNHFEEAYTDFFEYLEIYHNRQRGHYALP